MDLDQISYQIASWLQNEKGLFIFSSNMQEEWLYKSFIDHILSHCTLDIYRDKYNDRLTHMNGIQNSIFMDDLIQLRYNWSTDNGYNYLLYKRIVGNVRDKIINQNCSQIIFSPLYNSIELSGTPMNRISTIGGGNSLVYMADFVAVIHENHLSLEKLRWDNSDDYSDIDLRVLIRDSKINTLLQ